MLELVWVITGTRCHRTLHRCTVTFTATPSTDPVPEGRLPWGLGETFQVRKSLPDQATEDMVVVSIETHQYQAADTPPGQFNTTAQIVSVDVFTAQQQREDESARREMMAGSIRAIKTLDDLDKP